MPYAAWSVSPNARTTFNTVANLGRPSGESALYKLSRPKPALRAIRVIPLARAIQQFPKIW